MSSGALFEKMASACALTLSTPKTDAAERARLRSSDVSGGSAVEFVPLLLPSPLVMGPQPSELMRGVRSDCAATGEGRVVRPRDTPPQQAPQGRGG